MCDPSGWRPSTCLRAEKGHVIVGAESEQRTTLTDLGMGWLWDREDVASRKVGAPALRACARQSGRMKLVGFRVDEGQWSPRDGALVVAGAEIVGHVCTTRRSDTLGWQYGMALVREEHAGRGGSAPHPRGRGQRSGAGACTATVVPPPFHDAGGERLRGPSRDDAPAAPPPTPTPPASSPPRPPPPQPRPPPPAARPSASTRRPPSPPSATDGPSRSASRASGLPATSPARAPASSTSATAGAGISSTGGWTPALPWACPSPLNPARSSSTALWSSTA